VLLTGGSACSFPLSFLLLLLLLLSEVLFLVFLTPFVFLYHGFSMEPCFPSEGEVEEIVKIVDVLGLALEVKLNLAVELGDEGSLEREVAWLAEDALIHKYLQAITFKQLQELLGSLPSHHLLICVHLLHPGGPLLEVSSLALVHASLSGSLHSLGLHKLGLLHL